MRLTENARARPLLRRLPAIAGPMAVAIFLLVSSRSAQAIKYESFIEVETEEDLYDLLAAGQIEQDSFTSLLELHQRGVDINSASREELYNLPNLTYRDVDSIIAYREEAGFIDDPAALVMAGVLSDRKLYAIASFLIVRPRKRSLDASGFVRFWSRYTVEDDRAPPSALRARVTTLGNLTVGMAATMTRNRVGDVVYDPNRQALSALPEQSRFHVPKGYAFWDTDKVSAIVGTYRIGFGQQLTFDKTNQATPNGIYIDDELFRDSSALARRCKQSGTDEAPTPCGGAARYEYRSPDYKWRDALFGAALGFKHISIGSGHMQAYGFASYQPRSIYQYELYNADLCADPHDNDNEACSAPRVYNRQDYVLAPSTGFSYHTLPNMFAETTVGGNLTYFASHRNHIGVTAYRSSVNWLTEGANLDFQEWSRLPYGGPFGAVGVDLSWGRRWFDLFAEVAQSFDSMPDSPIDQIAAGGGGPAAIVRGTITWDKNELETLVRYYDIDFANPNAGPTSAPDELDGLRARDEVGARVRYTGTHGKLNLRTAVDVWQQPSIGQFKLLTFARADFTASKKLGLGLWLDYQDKGLGEPSMVAPDPDLEDVGECYELPNQEDVAGEPIPCTGQQVRVTGRFRVTPSKKYQISGNVRYSYLNDFRQVDSEVQDMPPVNKDFRHDLSVTAIGLYKPTDDLRARVRLRYLFEDVSDNQRLEQLFWAYADLTYRLWRKNRLRLRYDVRLWLDERSSTEQRTPSPEHWMWLEFESRF